VSGPRRVPLVAGNWKMHTTVPEGIELARAIVALDRPPGVEVAVLPPFVHLWPLEAELRGSGVGLGAQDVFWEDAGAFTGEVSPAMLAGWCDMVLVGHSERRHLLGETDEQVARKLRRALTHPLRVIVAVGETLEQRERGITLDVCHGQLDAALGGLDAASLDRCVVAYEPVWAIGTGRTATPEQAQEVCAAIRAHAGRLVSSEAAAALLVLYGGSVTAENAASIFAQPDIDGGLIGGASLKPAVFGTIVAAAAQTATVER
jgi:triosephosphate isomerase (TIM)